MGIDIKVVLIVFLVVTCLFLFIGLPLLLIFIKKRNDHVAFVKANSIALKNLVELNSRYKFYEVSKNYDLSHTYDNDVFYGTVSPEDYLIYNLQFNRYNVLREIMGVSNNVIKLTEYKKEVKAISSFGKYESEVGKLNIEYLLKIERKLFSDKTLKPTTVFAINVSLAYAKMSGEVCSRKSGVFTGGRINQLIDRLNNQDRGFYNDRGIWDAICRVERAKVSNKMRFSIYQRDGYRCRMCGRHFKMENLEIDHIKPIAKGGKTTYDNLQTLCRRCNKLKGDSY